MTTIQKNVMIVIDAMLFLTWPPRTSAFTWARLLKAVSLGQKMVLKSQEAFYLVMKVEPVVFERLLPFLEITARQGAGLFEAHNNLAEVALRRKAWRGYY
jgi:hypothetical protein